jgi:DNA-binding transcriptional LysR family regulator
MVTDNDESIPLLRQGKLDLIFNTLPVFPYEGTAQEWLYDADWVVCAAANHPLFRKRRISIADLGRENWALSYPNLWPASQTSMAKLFQNRQFPPPRIAILTRSLRLRLHIYATTRLLGFTSRHVLRGAAGFKLKEIPIKELTWHRQVGAIYRKDAYLSPAARRFIDILKSAAQDLGKARG